jgi:hypothetical protein
VGLEVGHERGHHGLRELRKEGKLVDKGGIVGARESVDDGVHGAISLSLKWPVSPCTRWGMGAGPTGQPLTA